MRRLFVAASLAATVALSGCATHQVQPQTPAVAAMPNSPLELTDWVLVALDGQLMPEFGGPTLKLDPVQHTLFASGGCNQLSGGYQVTGDKISIPGVAGTRMACDADSMKTEASYLQDLQSVTRFHVDGDTLDLLRNDDLLLRFRAKPKD